MFDFAWALNRIKEGEKVRRKAWPQDAWVRVKIPLPSNHYPYIEYCGGSGKIEVWRFNYSDLFARDWQGA